jgi:phosphoribosylamine--glycine ligase
LEFNVRFGDPEAQVILPRLKNDLLELMIKASERKLDEVKEVKFYNKAAVCVVMAANGYPEKYQKGTEIKNLAKIENDNALVFHAGTIKKNDKILANGGRVLGLVGIDSNIKKARESSYKAVHMVDWEDGYFRNDIALYDLTQK